MLGKLFREYGGTCTWILFHGKYVIAFPTTLATRRVLSSLSFAQRFNIVMKKNSDNERGQVKMTKKNVFEKST